MAHLDQLKIVLRTQLCLLGVSEDEIQALVGNLSVETVDKNTTLVTANGGIQVQFVFGSDGNFVGAFAQLGGKSITIIFGTGSGYRGFFRGSPSATNPGPGWQVDVEASRRYLQQSGPENTWDAFYAERVAVVSTIP